MFRQRGPVKGLHYAYGSRLREEVQVEIVRFIEACQPNIVEARFFDSEARCHTFIDKSAIFSTDWSLDEATKYPQPGVIRCQVLARWQVPLAPNLFA
jgi:hypothetical protein